MKKQIVAPKQIVFHYKISVLLFLLLLSGFSLDKVYCQNDTINTNLHPDTIANANEVWDRFSVSFGGFFAGYQSDISIGNKQLGLGVQIDVENALGLQTSRLSFKGNAKYRIGEKRRHALIAGYFGIYRRSTKILETELVLGDSTFPIGTAITSKYDLNILRIKYAYSFYQDNRISLGASIGFFIIPISFSVNTTSLGGKATDIIAPLPVVGFHSKFHITDKFYIDQSAEFLYLSFGEFTGSIVDIVFVVGYKPIEHFELGFGINSSNMEISSEGNKFPGIDYFGTVKMGYTGVFLMAAFTL